MWKKFVAWLDERLGLNDLQKNLLDRPEPKGNWWNTLGSASLFLFLLQGATGIFLSVYYTPSPDHAYDSIQYIMNDVAFGWLVRGIHHWGATLMVLVVFIHLLRVFVTASFKYPRELTWIIGVGLLIATLGMGFTGYLLPWNQRAYWATTVGTQIAGSVPLDRRIHPEGPARRHGPERADPAAVLLRAHLDRSFNPGWFHRCAHVPHHPPRRIALADQGRLRSAPWITTPRNRSSSATSAN